MPRGRRAPPRSRCATRRAGARTPSATAACCWICWGIPKAAGERRPDGIRRRQRHAAGRPGRGAPGVSGAHRASSSAPSGQEVAALRRGRRLPADRRAERRAAHLRGVRGERRRRVEAAACARSAWAYDAPLAPTSVTAAPVVTGAARAASCRSSIDGIEPGETGSLEISSPDGRDRAGAGRPATQTRVEVPCVPRRHATPPRPITVTPYSRFELPPGLGGSASGAAVTVQANGIGSPLSPHADAQLGLERRRHVDRHRARRGRARRRRVEPALRHRARRRALHDGRDAARPRPSRAAPTARSTRFTRVRRVVVGRRSLRPRHDDDRERARAAVRQGAAGLDVRRRRRAERAAGSAPTGSSAQTRPPTERIPNRNRAEFAGWTGRRRCSTATPASRCATSTSRGAPRPTWATRRRRAPGSAPVPGAGDVGGRRRASAGATLAASRPTRRNAAGRPAARSRSATPALRYFDAAGAAASHPSRHLDRARSARCGSRASA